MRAFKICIELVAFHSIEHLGALGAVCMHARQLGFAALGNNVPTKAVVVLDLTPKRLFKLLGVKEGLALGRSRAVF